MTDRLRIQFDLLLSASRTAPSQDAVVRRALLERLATLIHTYADGFSRAISDDFGGRSLDETRFLEIVPTMRAIRYAQKHVARWMRDERRPVDWVFQPAQAWVRHEPLGVVGIVSPWNYPIILSLGPLIDALAAGNRVMLKPSELTPRFSALLAEAIATHFPADQVTVAIGGVETAKDFTALPFDHLLFTGSTAVGRQVMRAAADHLTPVTLELGGKSPAFIAPDYPLDKAAASVTFGKFVNAGQTCIAPDYALVPWAERERFARAVLDAAQRAYPTVAGNSDYSAVLPRQRARLLAAVEEARAAGATILNYADNDPEKIAPTVVIDPPLDGSLMREEIFGPVLPVIGYHNMDEAIALMNERDRPLALYCFSNIRKVQQMVMDRVPSGGVTLNGTLLHIAQDALPFGGLGASGMGAYHGHEGFLRMSHSRAVHKVGPVNVFERLGPPWRPLARFIAQWLSR